MAVPKLARQDTPTPTKGADDDTNKESEAVDDLDTREDDDDDFERDDDAKATDSLLKDYDKV